MGFSNAVGFFIIPTAASTSHVHGITNGSRLMGTKRY
jgi:hypothetical protein